MTDAPAELPCQDKLAFDTEKQARAAATTAEYQHGTKLKVYHCRHCGLWHLSSA
ncbi:MAG TPA: hypothetical protein VHD60_00245 [Candidatus Saccharimonadales bacterium]|nr:hypothetical protein [Candidatus Saccharimonadales bacterium]